MNSASRIIVTPGFCVIWALILLILPLRLILAAAAAACFHELCHALAIRMLGGRVMGLTIGAGGMVMETEPMEPWREILCALAGPAGSMLLIIFSRWCPLLSACAFIHGCFNLLPLYPLDGGRALVCVLRMILPGRWKRAQFWIEFSVLFMLFLLAIGMGPGAVAAWGMLAIRKIPCKADRFGVQ